jgi:acyl dehydratase
MDEVRFTAPVKIGDTIHSETEIVALDAKDAKRGVITNHNRIVNQRGEPCCMYTTKILCGRRPK